MKSKKGGFTLVEIIVSLALIGIIAIGIIPAFAAQLKMTINTKEITSETFDAQGEIERVMSDLIVALQSADTSDEDSISGVTKPTKTIFGYDITMYRLEKDFPGNASKQFVVFLSKKLAQMEIKQLLSIDWAKIDVTGDDGSDLVADLKKATPPQLIGLCSTNTDANWYANIFNWYVSKAGDTDPTFPEDFIQVHYSGNPSTLTDLSPFANRQVIFGVIPVDIHGVRGNEKRSTPVNVLGPEWRAGTFAWLDKDENATFEGDEDVLLKKTASLPWVLLRNFDTEDSIFNPDNPSDSLNGQDGSLYVPMNISPPAMSVVGPVEASTSDDVIEWIVDKDINLASDINATNNSDIHLQSREGSVILYQYLQLSTSRAAIYQTNGLPYLINDGASLNTASGDILLDTEKRGNVIMQNYSSMNSGNDISMSPFGNISIYQGSIQANGSILLDTTEGPAYYGNNRDLIIQNSAISLTGSSPSNTVTLNVPDSYELSVSSSVFTGNSSLQSPIIMNGEDGIVLKATTINNAKLMLNNNTVMQGGGWNSQSTVTVKDGKSIELSASGTKVNNAGSMILGNTGSVAFANNMTYDLANPLTINLSATAEETVMIDSNYGRNIGYADPISNQSFLADGTTYQNLGSENTNLKYMVEKLYGSGNYILSSDFDGTNQMTIRAGGGDNDTYAYYILNIADKYAEDIVGTIKFKVYKGPTDSVPTVDILGSNIPTHTVTFNLNGGTIDGSSNSIVKTINDGSSIGSDMPTANPSKYGFNFIGWNTATNGLGTTVSAITIVNSDITAYAQWSTIPVYTVTFLREGGQLYATRSALYNTSLGANMPSAPTRSGYLFDKWTVGGTEFNSSTPVLSEVTAISNWTSKKYFSTLNAGDYVVIGSSTVKFQVISNNMLLRRDLSTSTVTWNDYWWKGTKYPGAKNLAADYYLEFSGTYPWVSGSGQLNLTSLNNLYNNTTLRNSVLRTALETGWWGDFSSGSNAYRVRTDEYNSVSIATRDKDDYSYYLRPYITISNPSTIYAASGDGSAANPYVLQKE